MAGRWSTEKAWEWYRGQPWLRGCNFMGSDCCNRVDQWQELGFEERLATADRELALAAAIGFNSIRLILQFEVWDQEHDGFMRRLDRYRVAQPHHPQRGGHAVPALLPGARGVLQLGLCGRQVPDL